MPNRVSISYQNQEGLSETVSSDNPLPVINGYIKVSSWDGRPFPTTGFAYVEIQLLTVAQDSQFIPQRSLTGGSVDSEWDVSPMTDSEGIPYSLVTSSQIGKCLSSKGHGYFRLKLVAGTSLPSGTIIAHN